MQWRADRGERGWVWRPDAVDRALGAFYGLAIGDALGMPTQMLPRAVVRDLFGELPWFAPGPEVNEISAGLPAGRVTDDTDQAVIVARTLIDGGGEIDLRCSPSGCSTGSARWPRPGRWTCWDRRPSAPLPR